jgi:hypothetical protein
MFPHPKILGAQAQADYHEANWRELYKEIHKKFDKNSAQRNVLAARINWYDKHSNLNMYIKYYLSMLHVIAKDSIKREMLGAINHFAWSCFLNVTEEAQLKKIIPWMERAVKQYPGASALLDTYANLLYKAGNKHEGISWEEKAAVLEKNTRDEGEYQSVVEQMKNEVPTYFYQGAVWDGVNWVRWDKFRFTMFITISDENSKPIAGVSVLNKRNAEIKQTEDKGSVNMEVMVGDTIEVTNPGYMSRQIIVTKTPGNITVVLKPTPTN